LVAWEHDRWIIKWLSMSGKLPIPWASSRSKAQAKAHAPRNGIS
jgi:hypothetical protein